LHIPLKSVLLQKFQIKYKIVSKFKCCLGEGMGIALRNDKRVQGSPSPRHISHQTT
jgi:hypothetical protein